MTGAPCPQRRYHQGTNEWESPGTHWDGTQDDFLGKTKRAVYFVNGVLAAHPCGLAQAYPQGLIIGSHERIMTGHFPRYGIEFASFLPLERHANYIEFASVFGTNRYFQRIEFASKMTMPIHDANYIEFAAKSKGVAANGTCDGPGLMEIGTVLELPLTGVGIYNYLWAIDVPAATSWFFSVEVIGGTGGTNMIVQHGDDCFAPIGDFLFGVGSLVYHNFTSVIAGTYYVNVQLLIGSDPGDFRIEVAQGEYVPPPERLAQGIEFADVVREIDPPPEWTCDFYWNIADWTTYYHDVLPIVCTIEFVAVDAPLPLHITVTEDGVTLIDVADWEELSWIAEEFREFTEADETGEWREFVITVTAADSTFRTSTLHVRIDDVP